MSIIPARCGPTSFTAAISSRARSCSRELKTTLARQNVTLLGELGFENAYALVMPRKRADALGIHSIADLAVACGHVVDRRRL